MRACVARRRSFVLVSGRRAWETPLGQPVGLQQDLGGPGGRLRGGGGRGVRAWVADRGREAEQDSEERQTKTGQGEAQGPLGAERAEERQCSK